MTYISKKNIEKVMLNPEIEFTPIKSIQDIEISSRRYERKIENENKEHDEQLRQISYSCIGKYESITEKMSKKLLYQVFLVIMSSLFIYYSITKLITQFVQVHLDRVTLLLIFVVCMITFLIVFILSIRNKNYSRTQFIIYFILFFILNSSGIFTILINSYQLSSYQVVNLYIYIITVQIIVFMLTIPITRLFICRSNIKVHNINEFI